MSTPEIDLEWTDAGGSLPVTYHIYRSKNGGSFSLLASVTDQLTYADVAPLHGDYRYYVVADNGQGDLTTKSNTTLTHVPGGPVTFVPSGNDTFTPTPSSTMTFTLVNAKVNPATFLDAVVIVTLDLYQASSPPGSAPTVDIDGHACSVLFTTGSTAGGDSGSRLRQAVAMVRIPNGGFSTGLVTVNWTGVTGSANVFATAEAFYNVDVSSDAFALGSVTNGGSVAGSTGSLTVPANGAFFIDEIFYVTDGESPPAVKSAVDAVAYTILSPPSGHLSSIGVSSRFPRATPNYRLFTGSVLENAQTVNGQSFRTYIAFVLAGTS